ncbi:MAG: 16S rRNA (cytosine(967)-C(5))-methyltransferase RsmB [Clostridiales bacterium]|nr:16S rRNA (cytosine(967)-C(5))-methyltransferase RsmB [Clostridiales bacterium]
MNAREVTLSTLLKTVQSRGYSNIELDSAIKKYSLEGAERGLFTALFYGVIERKITLDYIISALSDRAMESIDIKVLTILEMGIYQLKFMDKIPESAAVNESVKLCEKFYAPKNSGAFVNALLRNYIRKKDGIPYPDRNNDYAKYLSVTYSVPEWICSLWIKERGNECEKMLEEFSAPPFMTLRVNTAKISVDEFLSKLGELGIKAYRGRISPSSVRLGASVPLSSLGSLAGLYFVQDEASQAAVAALGVKEGDTVIDCCACPGGKSFGAATDMNGKGKVLSFDLHKSKLSLIEKTAAALGISIIETAVQNGAQKRENMPLADKIICDVPCSCLGVISKKPDIRYKAPDDIKDLPALQAKILENNASYLKAGGDMVYSTCTVNKRENEDVVNAFLKKHGEFSLCPFETGELRSMGMIQILPHHFKTDGFFIAKLHKNQG